MSVPDEAERIGRARQAGKSAITTRRFFSDPAEENIVGAAGELLFALKFAEFGFGVDRRILDGGDGGSDFASPLGKIGVKTARRPVYLLVKVKEHWADVYVLCGHDGRRATALIGWEWGEEMRKCPTRDFGYGIVSHYRRASLLRPMAELREWLAAVP